MIHDFGKVGRSKGGAAKRVEMVCSDGKYIKIWEDKWILDTIGPNTVSEPPADYTITRVQDLIDNKGVVGRGIWWSNFSVHKKLAK